MKLAAIYARVSSEQQREQQTIASQTAALIEFARSREFEVPKEWLRRSAEPVPDCSAKLAQAGYTIPRRIPHGIW
ncbi:MAG: hypothetical protein WA642_12310 [Steroidobacteraceae bacterium]